jgi:hypothetical protein
VDIGKYEHVAVVTNGFGELIANPWRFGIRRCDTEEFFERIDRQCGDGEHQPLIGMEPTGHYYEQLAYESAARYGAKQVYLIQSYDTAQRRKIWSKGTFKNDEVEACIVAELLREGHGRTYRPPSGVYLILYHLERYRLAREQAATRLKNQIIGHVDRLYPGLAIRERELAKRYKAMFRYLWTTKTPVRLLRLFPDPYQLRQQTSESLFQHFRAAGYWMNRPYAARIMAVVQNLCLPDPGMVAIRSRVMLNDLSNLAVVEQQVADAEAEMESYLDQTWAKWLLPTGARPALVASLAATIGDMQQYQSARQIFGRSGLHSGCKDSGIRQRRGQGRHIVAPGDRHLRRQLMRFSYSMTPRYPALQRFKTQLVQRGLSKTGAHIAIARRLTGVIFSLATKQEPFDPGRFQ